MPLPGHSEVWTQPLREEMFQESPATSSAISTSEGQVRLGSGGEGEGILTTPCDSTSSQASVLQQGSGIILESHLCWPSVLGVLDVNGRSMDSGSPKP